MQQFCPQLSGTDLEGTLVKVPCQEHACHWYQMLMGPDPQTGVKRQEWGCAIVWANILSIENTKEASENVAATHNFRNILMRLANGETAQEIAASDQTLLLAGTNGKETQ